MPGKEAMGLRSHYFNQDNRPDGPVLPRDTESHGIAEKVCAALGDTWRVERTFRGSGHAYLHDGETGLILDWCAETRTFEGPIEKWTIDAAVWQHGNEYELPSPEIKVSAAKSAEQIARDIARRLLPMAKEVTEKVKQSVHGYALNEHKRWTLAHRLADRYPGRVGITSNDSPHDRYRRPSGIIFGHRSGERTHMRVEFNDVGGDVDLQNVSTYQLEQLLDLVATWNA